MFRTWRIRWRNPVWVCKLADIVTNLWLGIIKLGKELFYVTPVFLDLLYNINLEWMRAWKCKQFVDFDKSTPTVKEERNRTLLHQTKLSIIFSSVTLTTIHSFSSKQWMTQRQSVYELSSWHITHLICVKHIKNSWMTISSVKSLSYYYSCQEQLSPFLVLTSESLLMSIVTFVYKPV